MKKTLRMKIMFLLFALVVGISSVFGETISFIFKGSGTNCTATSGSVSGVYYVTGKTGSASATAYNAEYGLVLYGVSNGGGYFNTSTEISGSITNIAVTTTNKKNSPKYNVYGSNNGSNWTQIGNQTDGGSTANFSTSAGYTYIKIANTTAATAQLAVVSIVITYTPSGGNTPTLESVTVTGTPNKATYIAGEYFDPTGLTVTAYYDNSTSANVPVSDATWEPGPTTPLTAGTTQVRATYNEVTSDYYTCINVYTLTEQSNNTSYGTVTREGRVVTGHPASGYTYATPAYTVSPANSATVEQNGNDFTVTPTENTTITINFEAIPCYIVTLSDDSQNPLTENSPGVGVTLPTRPANGSYAFAGWSESNVSEETTEAPTIIPAGTYYPTANTTLYPVYTKSVSSGTTTEWHLTTLSAADAGVYALLTTDGHAFNGSISSGNGQVTSGENSAFVFNNNNVATTIPSGICEITFTAVVENEVTVGYTMYNSSKGYLYAIAASSGKLAWHNSESSYWSYPSNDWIYNSNSAHLRSYSNNSIRTYSSNSYGDLLKLAKKVTVPNTTTYYWSSPTAVETPEITVAETFVTSTTATISCATDGATIYYSYDNSTWNEYTDELTITETTTIYAKAQKGEDLSKVVSATTTKLLEPTITIDATGITTTDIYTSTAAGSLSASVTYNSNPIDGATVSWSGNKNAVATIDASTGAVTLVSAGSVTFTATYEGNNVYAGKTATYDMTVTNSTPDYATLPFTFTGGKAEIANTLGLTQSGLGTDYSDPKLRFDNTDDNVILKTNSAPGAIIFDIKGQKQSGTWSGTFSVQISEDGETYDNLTEFTSLPENVQTVILTNNNASVRYIKWIFTSKTSGFNVGIGNISVQLEATHSTTINPVADHVYVVNSGATLILDGDYSSILNNPSNLIIEDGGQLISQSTVVATVQKTITAPTSWAADDNSGWYAISSTVGSIANNNLSSVINLVPVPVNEVTQFDLYKYVEGSGWLNYAAHTQDFGGLANGHGYLYANKNGATLSFAGNITTSDVVLSNLSATSSNNNLKGIHLIGNPYTHNIYKGVAINASNGTLSDGYYKLNGSNLWVAESDATPIAPGQGFLVKVTDGTTLTLHNTASSARANNDYIRFAVANSQYEDATFAMFKEGTGLTKINHRNAEAPMIYINQDNTNYAIATMSDATESFSLNFKAMTTGQYTLSFTTQGEFNYLHVIDRLTGADIDMLLEGEYKFIGTPNDSDNRFIVRLAYLPDYGEENGIFAYQSGSEIFVSGEGELQIFDVTGRFVLSERINGVNTINADALSKGVYVLRIIGSEIKTQKIVVR